MKITLHYKFNDYYREGSDSIKVTYNDFPYDVIVEDTDVNKTIEELVEDYREDALATAAYKQMCEYSELFSKGLY